MPQTVFRVDQSKSMRDQEVPGHNRWHPDVPAAAQVRRGDEFRIKRRPAVVMSNPSRSPPGETKGDDDDQLE